MVDDTPGTGPALDAGPAPAGEDGELPDRVWTVPNALSLARLLLVPVFLVLIVEHHDVWALVVLVVSGLSDWLDGFLARRWHQLSRLGRLLDPAADRLFIICSVLGLASRGIIPWWLVVLVVGRDLVLAPTVPLLTRHGHAPLQVRFLGKAATLNLLYAFPLLLLAQVPGVVGDVALPVAWAFVWWGAGLYWFTGAQYLAGSVRLLRGPDGPGAARG